MPAARTIVTRALGRLRIGGEGETITAEEAADTLADLNSMLAGLALDGADLLYQPVALDEELRFWVPPVALSGAAIAAASYKGTWSAATNTPALASGAGTMGDVWRVAVAGTTSLDGLASWALHDFLVYDGAAWRKCRSSEPHTSGLIDLLASRIADDYGKAAPARALMGADEAWRALRAQFIVVDEAGFDTALVRTTGRRGDDWW
jgi:hypothetical protein